MSSSEHVRMEVVVDHTGDQEVDCISALTQVMDSFDERADFGMKPATKHRIANWFSERYGDNQK